MDAGPAAAYLNEEKGIPIKRGRIDDLLVAEGLGWRQQESWFGERAGVERPPGEDGEDRRSRWTRPSPEKGTCRMP